MAITYMTPAHRSLVDTTLVAVHNRAVELVNVTNYPLGKNPAQPTIESARESPLGRDLELIVHYVEGHKIEGNEVNTAIQRVLRIIYGYTLHQKGYNLLKDWQKTPVGELIGEAHTRMIPPKDLMGTADVQRVFGIKRQTVYDWVDEAKLTAYYIRGKQMFYRPDIEKEAQKRARTKPRIQQL